MITRNLLAAIAAAAVLGGCATEMKVAGMDGGATLLRRTCIFTPCRAIAVEVVDGKVKVDVDELKMYPGSRNLVLVWRLETPGWEFRTGGDFANPVIFKGDNAPDAPSQFSDILVREVRGIWYATIFNRNTNTKRYEYKVRIYRKGGGPNDFLESDPAILNDY